MKISFWIALLLSSFAYGQGNFYLSGTVKDSDGDKVYGVKVTVHELARTTISNIDGEFLLKEIPKGHYHLHFEGLGYKPLTLDTFITANLSLNVSLDFSHNELEETIIELDPLKQDQEESSLSLRVIDEKKIIENSTTNLAAGLEQIEGVHTQNVGVSVAKPVIRGYRANRVLVVNNNIRQEEQQWGEDHGLSIDQFGVDQVIILKGPAALVYGSDAIGGVIKMDKKYGLEVDSYKADLHTYYRSVNNTVGFSTGFLSQKKKSLFGARFGIADYGDYKVPTNDYNYLGYVIPIDNGKLKNTAGQDISFDAVYGRNFTNGFSRLLFSGFIQKAGVFSGASGLPTFYSLEPDGDRNVVEPYRTVNHFKLVSETTKALGEGWVDVVLGIQENIREEYINPRAAGFPFEEDSSLASKFRLRTLSGNFTYHLPRKGKHEDVIGVQLDYQNNKTSGYNYVLPDFDRFNSGVYGLRKWDLGNKWVVNSGVRLEYVYLNTQEARYRFFNNYQYVGDAIIAPASYQNYFSWAANLGLSKRFSEYFSWKTNLARSFRAPQVSELFSSGAHGGTFRFVKGNQDLTPEVAYQLDMVFDFEKKPHHVSLTPFFTYFNNYIYLTPSNQFPTQELVDGSVYPYPEIGQQYQYMQHNAMQFGGELLYHVDLLKWLGFEGQFDVVYGHNIEENRPLPFMPPMRAKGILETKHTVFNAKSYIRLIVQKVFDQNRVDRNEKTTDGYWLLNAQLGADWNRIGLKLNVENFTNTVYLKHLSVYRQVNIPEPATNFNVVFSYKLKGKKKN